MYKTLATSVINTPVSGVELPDMRRLRMAILGASATAWSDHVITRYSNFGRCRRRSWRRRSLIARRRLWANKQLCAVHQSLRGPRRSDVKGGGHEVLATLLKRGYVERARIAASY